VIARLDSEFLISIDIELVFRKLKNSFLVLGQITMDKDLKTFCSKVSLEERKFRLERERLEIEKQRLTADNSFINRNSSAIISAAVSLAAIIVSITQIWVAEIQKQREYELNRQQKEKELSLASSESERRWRIELVKFVSENKESIFHGSQQEQTVMRDLMVAIFPPDLADRTFHKFAVTANTEARAIWDEGRKVIGDLIPKLQGDWKCLQSCPSNDSKSANIIQNGNNLLIVDNLGRKFIGVISGENDLVLHEESGLTLFGSISNGTIILSDGSVWSRK
jgi:hypothetical protein